MRSVLPFVVTLLAAAFAVPSPHSDNVVHEIRVSEPTTANWIKAGRLDSNKILPMHIGLAQQNLHRLEEMLMSVSHPESPKFAQHFTPMEIVDTFAPSEKTISAVTNWLVDSGFSRDRLRLSLNKAWIHLNASTSEVENLLNTEYHVYTHPSGDTQIGCHNYSLPKHLQQHVDLIKPTVHFNHRPVGQPSGHSLMTSGGPVGPITGTDSLKNCSAQMTLDCVRALYDFRYTPRSTKKNTFGIVAFTPNSYLDSDLDMFFRNFSPRQVGVRPQVVLIDGAVVNQTNQSDSRISESSLDLQLGMGLTYPQEVTLLQVGDSVQGGSFGNFLDAVDASYCGGDDPTQDGIYPNPAPGGYHGPESCGIIKPPNVISISYGLNEGNVTFAYAQRQCREYAKLGMMGTSVIISSGDKGVAGANITSPDNDSDVCQNSTHRDDANGINFNPSFPASCPYVTSVGATQMKVGSTVDDPEVAANFITPHSHHMISGSGFSNFYELPEYQRDAVKDYSRRFLNPSPFAPGQYNDSGNARAYPDISANGALYLIAINGEYQRISGTSASAPVIAAMITMINDARLSVGKEPVGFINPTIYNPAFSWVFNDITSGHNGGCGTNGFVTAEGWDPVTGVGTPKFEKLLEVFLLLP